jgi:hypothetical protein
MSAKTDYIRTETTALKTQIQTLLGALGQLMTGIKQAEADAAFRDANSETPNRANSIAKFTALKGAVDAINAISLSVPSVEDFTANFDAAVEIE